MYIINILYIQFLVWLVWFGYFGYKNIRIVWIFEGVYSVLALVILVRFRLGFLVPLFFLPKPSMEGRVVISSYMNRLSLMSLGEAQCWLQLLLGTMNSRGLWKMPLNHFKRLCFRLTIDEF